MLTDLMTETKVENADWFWMMTPEQTALLYAHG